MTERPYQLLPPLSGEQRHLLRQSIEKNGVLEAVVFDEDGEILDGHHRVEIAEELGIDYPRRVIEDLSEAAKQTYALTVNVARRQLTQSERGSLVARLRSQGMSIRAIADATGLPKSTVSDDIRQLSESGQLNQPERTTGLDGKERPASQPRPPRPPAVPDAPPVDLLAVIPGILIYGSLSIADIRERCPGEPDLSAVESAVRELEESGRIEPAGRGVNGNRVVDLWALAELPAEDLPAPAPGEGLSAGLPSVVGPADESDGSVVNPGAADKLPAGPDTVALVDAAMRQHLPPDLDAPRRAWGQELYERLEPINGFTLWFDIDVAAEFADDDDVETLHLLALSFTRFHERLAAAQQSNAVPLRRAQ